MSTVNGGVIVSYGDNHINNNISVNGTPTVLQTPQGFGRPAGAGSARTNVGPDERAAIRPAPHLHVIEITPNQRLAHPPSPARGQRLGRLPNASFYIVMGDQP
jgi:hypothetical protein